MPLPFISTKNNRSNVQHSAAVRPINLDAVFVDVDIVASGTALGLAKQDQLFEQKHVSQAFFASVTDDELGLATKHPLLVQIHLCSQSASDNSLIPTSSSSSAPQPNSRLVLGVVTITLAGVHSRYFPGHLGTLSLAIPPRVGAASTCDVFGHRWGRNGEFCVAVGPVTRTAGILTYCMLA